MKKLVIFASGSGSNFQAIIDGIENGEINAQISGLISDRIASGASIRAKNHQIPFLEVTKKNPDQFLNIVSEQLAQWEPDLIVLAGFLRKVPDEIVNRYSGKIINIHPSLLPKYGGKGFYGLRVHEAVLESGDLITGCTVHFVNEEYDRGDIIMQQRVDVLENDTPEELAARVLKAEHQLLPAVINKLLKQLN